MFKRWESILAAIWRPPALSFFVLLAARESVAGEGPFFVTYTHQLEEPGNLEAGIKSVSGSPGGGGLFIGSAMEFEYGMKAWWTTEVYLDGQSTRHDSTVFTGFRWENRFRLLPREHWINSVVYVEFEDIHGADKTLLEVVGNDGKGDLREANLVARREKQREIEGKLILSSHFKGWTVSENLIAEKNVVHEPFEFGYAAGVSRPLALTASSRACEFCRENFEVGAEVYGGLGIHSAFGFHDTSHYIAPTVVWNLTNGTAIRLSPGFGLTKSSNASLFRFAVSCEVAQVGRQAQRLFGRSGGGGTGAPVQRQNPFEADPDAARTGAKLFRHECSACHGRNGQGIGKTPALNSAEVHDAAAATLFRILRDGSMKRGMPSFAHLPEQQRWQILAYVRTLRPE